MIIRSISDELEERIWHRPDYPCRAKKNTNNFFIGNFTILAQLCDFFLLCFDLFLILIIYYRYFSFDLYYPINLVATFSWPPTRDIRNYQLLVICHARSNVTSLNLSLKKKVKAQQQNHKAVLKLWNYR